MGVSVGDAERRTPRSRAGAGRRTVRVGQDRSVRGSAYQSLFDEDEDEEPVNLRTR
ncbi:hypothetical protein SNOUR_20705 [Streptomyces noursei ATCC 11455]|nr:hypothetical protein SNOUR_20705 [Streptomyces noursei ATCC 11455]